MLSKTQYWVIYVIHTSLFSIFNYTRSHHATMGYRLPIASMGHLMVIFSPTPTPSRGW